MERYQEQAWDCLTEQEQNCLFLNHSQGLSSREAGEIIKVTHYKYLEIKARSEKFFKMFSDYFMKHPSLFRPDVPISMVFRDYLIGSIMKRLPKEDALLYAGDSSWLVSPIKTPQIIKQMERLRSSKDEWDKDLYALIIEFDRWNNYRILPRILQAPTPYKRRSAKKDKIYLQYLHRIPDFKIRAMVDMYWRHGKPDKRYYISMVSTTFPDGYAVVPIKRDKEIIDNLTRNKIYIFEDQLDADEFGLMCKNYFEERATISSAMDFWKRYRELVETAINYRGINNMDFTVGNLDMAYNLKRKPMSEIVKRKRK